MPNRLDHSKAKIPEPTPRLFEMMGQVAYSEFVMLERLIAGDLDPKVESWHNIKPEAQEAWIGTVRRVWKFIAVKGGAVEKHS